MRRRRRLPARRRPPRARRTACAHLDLFGHGHSDRPASSSCTLEAHAASVAALLDREEIGRAVLIGHSMGGSVAITLAAMRPELLSRVIVAEPNLHAGGGAHSNAIAAHTEQDFFSGGATEVPARFEPGYAARVRVADPTGVHRGAVGLVRGTTPDTAAHFFALPHPKAFLLGVRSRPCEDEQEVRRAGIPVVELPDAGHEMMHDSPSGFAAALLAAGARDGRRCVEGRKPWPPDPAIAGRHMEVSKSWRV